MVRCQHLESTGSGSSLLESLVREASSFIDSSLGGGGLPGPGPVDLEDGQVSESESDGRELATRPCRFSMCQSPTGSSSRVGSSVRFCSRSQRTDCSRSFKRLLSPSPLPPPRSDEEDLLQWDVEQRVDFPLTFSDVSADIFLGELTSSGSVDRTRCRGLPCSGGPEEAPRVVLPSSAY